MKNIEVAFKLLGKNYFFRNKSEKVNVKFKRSIYTIEEIKKGQKFTKNNLKIIRPGYGLNPYYFEKLLNKKSPVNIKQFEKNR